MYCAQTYVNVVFLQKLVLNVFHLYSYAELRDVQDVGKVFLTLVFVLLFFVF